MYKGFGNIDVIQIRINLLSDSKDDPYTVKRYSLKYFYTKLSNIPGLSRATLSTLHDITYKALYSLLLQKLFFTFLMISTEIRTRILLNNIAKNVIKISF